MNTKFLIIPLLLLSVVSYSQYGMLFYYANNESISLMNPSFGKETSFISNNLAYEGGLNSQFYNVTLLGKNGSSFSLIHLNENDYGLNGFSTSLQYAKSLNKNLFFGTEFTFTNNEFEFPWTNDYGHSYIDIKNRYSQRIGAGITFDNENFFIGGALKLSNRDKLNRLPFVIDYNIQIGGHVKLDNIKITPSLLIQNYENIDHNLITKIDIKRKWLSLQAGVNPSWNQFSYGISFYKKNIQFGYVLSKDIYSNLALNWNTSHNIHVTFQLNKCKN